MHHFSHCALFVVYLSAASICVAPVAGAVSPEDVVGRWKTVTNFNGRDLESEAVFEIKDGALVGKSLFQMGGGQGRGPGNNQGGGPSGQGVGRGPGSRELLDVKLEGDTLSWGMIMPRAGNEPLITTVKITGNTFEGATKTPLGEAKVTGRKWTAEDEQKLRDSIQAMLGDWDIITTYNGQDAESQMRLAADDDGGFDLSFLMPGGTLAVRRVRFDGSILTFSTNMPFIGNEPARGQLKIADNKCEGTIASPLGDIAVRGELINTAKLVLAPYDDPAPVLGMWDVTANVRGEESKAKLALQPDGERIKGILTTGEGTIETKDVDYKKVGDKMGRVKMKIVIPSLGEKPQDFELIFNGDGFEGEEIHSNGAIFFEGKRAAN